MSSNIHVKSELDLDIAKLAIGSSSASPELPSTASSKVDAEGPDVAQPETSDDEKQPQRNIPSRVKCNVPLKIETSTIKEAGYGVLVSEKVKAGDLVFSIADPFLNIIEDGEVLNSVCDNCLTTKVGDSTSSTENDIRFKRCSACEIMKYCSKECQKTAWDHHHKFECKALKALLGSTKSLLPDTARQVRCMTRLLVMHGKGKISDEDMDSFFALQHNIEKADKETLNNVKTMSEIYTLRPFGKLTQEMIIRLLYTLGNNEVDIYIPLLMGNSHQKVYFRSMTKVGCCFDPFAALVNHSCEPNSYFIFEGKELRLRASKNILPSEELTVKYNGFKGEYSNIAPGAKLVVSYGGPIEEYSTRRQNLKTRWSINCTCELCQRGDIGPKGALHDELMKLGSNQFYSSRSGIEKIVADLKSGGFGYDTYPMHKLHWNLLQLYVKEKNGHEAFKICLKLRYVIERVHVPRISLTEQVGTLFMLNTFIQQYSTSTAVEQGWGKLPGHITALFSRIGFHLKAQLVDLVVKCYGQDSAVARFEKDFFDKVLALMASFQPQSRYVRMEVGAPGYAQYVENTNKLLEWAGIEAMSGEDILSLD